MKISLLITSLLLGTSAFAVEADSTGLEGDHLDLDAVMAIFKDSESPEDFEKKLNTESYNINNLDLDSDGEVDYIRVVDAGDSTSHVLTLQVPINETESQDIATIELEATDNDVVEIQIVGDEELYGDNYVLLPESAGRGPVIINVIMWRPVRFMWAPRYTPWVSPWRFRTYPAWHRPWKRRSWGHYHRNVVVYRGGCRRVYARSFTHAHAHHYHRTHSASFHTAHHHNHAGKTASKPGSTSAKSTKASIKPNGASQGVTKTSTQATSKKEATAKESATPKTTNTKSAVTPNTKKVTTTHQQKTKSTSPAQNTAPTQKSTTKSTKTGTRQRSGASSTKSKGGRSGKSGRSSGGGNRKK